MTTVTAFGNKKGGTGKTTMTLALAGELAHQGASVLVVDLDGQANASGAIAAADEYPVTILDLLDAEIDNTQAVTLADALADTLWPKVDVIPGSRRLDNIERAEAAAMHALASILRDDLVPATYDHVLIDLPPSIGMRTYMGLLAADQVVIVSDPEPFSESGTVDYLDELDKLRRRRIAPNLRLAGVLLNRFDARQSIHLKGRDAFISSLGDEMLPVVVGERSAFIDVGNGIPLHESKKASATDALTAIRDLIPTIWKD